MPGAAFDCHKLLRGFKCQWNFEIVFFPGGTCSAGIQADSAHPASYGLHLYALLPQVM